MAVQDDRALSESLIGAVVGGPTPTSWEDEVAIERDFTEHRAAVLAMLRADFPRLQDPEELYQEAWAELLELRARGEVVRNVRALLKKIAWRRAADVVRRRSATAVDPASPVLAFVTDSDPLPDEQAQVRLDADALRLVVESLEPRQAAALKLRFDLNLTAREIQARLGVSEKRLEKIVTEAYKQVLHELGRDDDEPRWLRRQRSLLLACELGIATARQRRRAQEMVDRDVRCRAMLYEMRATLDDVAAVLPIPVLVEHDERLRPLEVLTTKVDELWSSTRGCLTDLAGRCVPSTPAVEQASVGSAALGAGATAKIVAACIAAGGTVALCVEGTRLLDKPAPSEQTAAPTRRIIEPPRQAVAVVRTAPAARTKRVIAKAAPRSQPKRRPERAVSSPRSTPAPSPAPAGATEFGPGAVGSGAAPAEPASAPSNGGGEFTP